MSFARAATLSGIAARYGTSPSRLASLNRLSKRNLIRVGQVLKLPGGPAKASADTTSADPDPRQGLRSEIYVVRRLRLAGNSEGG